MSLKDPNVVDPKKRKRIAIVIANPAISTTTQWPVGFWWSELTHPYYVFSDVGYEVEIFSPKGGKCEADGMSDPRDASGYSSSDLISMGFIATPKLAGLVESTKPVTEVNVTAFDALVVAGGHRPPQKIRRVLCSGQGRRSALSRRRGSSVRETVEWPASRQRQDRHGFRQRRRRLCRPRGLADEGASGGQAHHALAHRRRAEEAGGQLRPGGTMARLCDARWQPRHRAAEFFG